MSDEKQLQEIEKWLVERDVDDLEVMICDHAGISRGKSMPRDKFLDGIRSRSHRVPDSLFAMTVDGDFIRNDHLTALEKDLIMVPDFSTLVMVPWQTSPTASVICDVVHENGTPASYSPRQVLRRVLELYADNGWKPIVAPEFEFYLLAKQDVAESPPLPPRGRSGKVDRSQEAYSIDAVDEFGDLFDKIYDYCEIQNVQVDTLIHEAGPGQFEFNVLHGEALNVADQSFYFKRIVKQCAIRYDLFASFMAKPYPEDYGSAMHIHQSVVDMKTGENIFADEAGKDTPLFLYHIGGMQKYLPAVMPILAPYVNSYLRIGSGWSAPTNTHWGRENRSVGLRVPFGGRAARRVENRIAGSDVNIYLALASTLLCGYLGMVEKIDPSPSMDEPAYDLDSNKLPDHILSALAEFESCQPIRDLLGDAFVDVYADIKRQEYDANVGVLSPWDSKYLLFNV